MSKNSRIKKTECKMVNKPEPADMALANLSNGYIVVCPAFFEEAIKPQLTLIEVFQLRDENFNYQDLPEDRWKFYSDNNHDACLFMHEGSGQLIIYATSKGQLYSCVGLFKAMDTIKEMELREAKKIILPQSA